MFLVSNTKLFYITLNDFDPVNVFLEIAEVIANHLLLAPKYTQNIQSIIIC